MKLVKGTVKYAAGTPKDFGFGPSISIKVTPNNGGDDIAVFGKPDDRISTLTRGEAVTLIGTPNKNDPTKTSYKVVWEDEEDGGETLSNGNGNGGSATSAKPAQSAIDRLVMSDDQKAGYAIRAEQQAGLWAFSLQKVVEKLAAVPETSVAKAHANAILSDGELLKDVVQSVFIQTLR